MELEVHAELLTLERTKPAQHEPYTLIDRIVIIPAAPAFYREPPRGHVMLWAVAAVGTLAVHLLFGYIWLTHKSPEQPGTRMDSILLDLTLPEPALAQRPELAQRPALVPLDQQSPEATQPPRETVPALPASSETQTLPDPQAMPDAVLSLAPSKPDLAMERDYRQEPRLDEQKHESRRAADDKKREVAQHAKLVTDQVRKEQQRHEAAERTKAARLQVKAGQEVKAGQAKAEALSSRAAMAGLEMAGWRSALFARIAAARRGGVSGTGSAAVIAFTVDRNGHIGTVHVARSSGSPSLDEEAAATVRRVGSAPPPPGGSIQSVSISMR